MYREGRKKQIESMVGRIVSGRGRNDGKGRTDHEKSVQNHEKDEGSIIKEQLAKVKDISRESALVQSFMGKSCKLGEGPIRDDGRLPNFMWVMCRFGDLGINNNEGQFHSTTRLRLENVDLEII